MKQDLVNTLQRLTEKPRGRGRLQTPATREAISESRSEAVPSGADATSGTDSCFGTLTDSSGFFILYNDGT